VREEEDELLRAPGVGIDLSPAPCAQSAAADGGGGRGGQERVAKKASCLPADESLAISKTSR